MINFLIAGGSVDDITYVIGIVFTNVSGLSTVSGWALDSASI